MELTARVFSSSLFICLHFLPWPILTHTALAPQYNSCAREHKVAAPTRMHTHTCKHLQCADLHIRINTHNQSQTIIMPVASHFTTLHYITQKGIYAINQSSLLNINTCKVYKTVSSHAFGSQICQNGHIIFVYNRKIMLLWDYAPYFSQKKRHIKKS